MAIGSAKLKQPTVQPLESVTLTLDADEVKTLLTILKRVGGSPTESARKHTDRITDALRYALKSVDVDLDTSDIQFDTDRSSFRAPNTIYFASESVDMSWRIV